MLREVEAEVGHLTANRSNPRLLLRSDAALTSDRSSHELARFLPWTQSRYSLSYTHRAKA